MLSLTVPMQNPRIVYEKAKYNFKSAFLNYTQRGYNMYSVLKRIINIEYKSQVMEIIIKMKEIKKKIESGNFNTALL